MLWGVPTSGRADFDWLFRGGLGRFLPEQWERLLDALPETDREGDPVEAFHRLLFDDDAEVRRRAALAWCTWESASPDWPPTDGLDSRFEDPAFALAFARLVTHYAAHDAWLEDGQLLREAGALAGISGVIVNGRFDLQAPLGGAWALHRAWPDCRARRRRRGRTRLRPSGHHGGAGPRDRPVRGELIRPASMTARGG